MSVPFASEISYNFDTPIWEIHTWDHFILVTTKNQTALQTRFSLVNTKKKELVFESLGFEEDWWIAVFLFNGEQIVFQVYNDTQDIEDRSVFCFDIAKEEVLWSIDGVKLQQVNAGTIQYSANADDETFLLDVATGTETIEPKKRKTNSKAQFPVYYNEENAYFPMLKKFLAERDEVDFLGGLEYLECKGLIFFGLNFAETNTYSLNLNVYDAEGNLLVQEILEHSLQGQASGSFFILDQDLIFVKEKSQLKICSIA